MTDDKQDPNVAAINNVIGWLAELDYPGVGTQMQRLTDVATALRQQAQPTRDAVLEEAAKVAEAFPLRSYTHPGYVEHGNPERSDIARAIRALKSIR